MRKKRHRNRPIGPDCTFEQDKTKTAASQSIVRVLVSVPQGASRSEDRGAKPLYQPVTLAPRSGMTLIVDRPSRERPRLPLRTAMKRLQQLDASFRSALASHVASGSCLRRSTSAHLFCRFWPLPIVVIPTACADRPTHNCPWRLT